MPIYEYQCPEGHVIDAYVPAKEIDLPSARTAVCYKCTQEGETNIAERIISPTPTTFKHADAKAIKDKA